MLRSNFKTSSPCGKFQIENDFKGTGWAYVDGFYKARGFRREKWRKRGCRIYRGYENGSATNTVVIVTRTGLAPNKHDQELSKAHDKGYWEGRREAARILMGSSRLSPRKCIAMEIDPELIIAQAAGVFDVVARFGR